VAVFVVKGWKKFVAFGDTHGDMFHNESIDALVKFIDHYKPDFKIHIGDLFDFRALRQGIRATECDAYDDLQRDTLRGYQVLERTKPDVLMLGNHDHRLIRVSEEHSNGIVRGAAQDGVAKLEQFCRKNRIRIYPYHYDKGIHALTDSLFFVHGFTATQRSVAEHAQHFGSGIESSVVMGHLHRIERSSGKRHGRATGYSIGCLCDYDSMTYAQHRLATSQWAHGFAYGVYNSKSHRVWLAEKTSGKWILPTGIEEF
jgi:UDP-2,3-diacylglucosamine pyrophosphatase LpxH